MTDQPTGLTSDLPAGGPGHAHAEIDPAVVEMVTAIRDRFGLRGLRDAEAMIDREIRTAEAALQELRPD